MSYHLLGATEAVVALPTTPAPAALPVSSSVPAVTVAEVADPFPITVTAGIPGFNLAIPVTTKQRMWLSIAMTVLVGVAGGLGIAALIKKAQV